ncbi:hypothetical protein [Streptomyces uncialis]|uniref:hypothetical protein n=1 Tax=Streptomyces uncialis TaxID=1048205 RepID=UPI00386F6C27
MGTARAGRRSPEPPPPDDCTTKYEYNAHGLMTKVTDANGNVSSNSGFGPHGLPATVTDALDKARNFVYDERGRTREVTDALGIRTTQTYDVYGRPLVHGAPKDQQGGVVITTPAPVYDANDNVTTSTSPTGAVSTAVYDAADQITEAAAPQDTPTAPIRRSLYSYDKVGNLLVTTEPKGALTTTDQSDYRTVNTYDGIDQLTSVANHSGDTVSYVYDNVGNLVTTRDPKKSWG